MTQERLRSNSLETPLGLRNLGESGDSRGFSGFLPDRGNMRRLVGVESEIRLLKELMAQILDKQDQLILDNNELKKKCANYDSIVKENSDMKQALEVLKNENAEFKAKAVNHEATMQEMKNKVEVSSEGVKRMEEKQDKWKNQREEVQESFRDIVNQQLEEKARSSFVQVMKDNENLVRDTVDKKKCVVIFGMKEDEEPNRFERERVERANITKTLMEVKREDSKLENEVEEFRRLGKYVQGKSRPLKIKFKSQVDAEEALAGASKLAKKEETKNIWIKKDLNREERAKVSELWTEATAKNEERTEEEKKVFYWKVTNMKIRKWYLRTRTEGSED